MASALVAGAVGIGSSIFGATTSAAAANQQAQAQFGMNQYQAQVATINQQVQLQNADFARQQGSITAMNYGLSTGQNIGQTKAAQASSGFDVNSGSAAQVRSSERNVENLNLNQIRANTALTAYNYDVGASAQSNQAGLYRLAGTNAVAAGNIAATSSIIGGASSVATKWMQASSLGMFNSSGSGLGGADFSGL